MTTFLVTTTADDGAGSLRDALAQAEANGVGFDDIIFDASLAGQTITLASQLFVSGGAVSVNGDLNGDGDPDVTISGGGATAILDIAAGSDVTLNALILTDGVAIGADGAPLSNADGESVAGAINNRGTLAINNSVLSSNAATGGNGGSEHADGGRAAGAILNAGQLNLSTTVFRDNQATGGNGSVYFDQNGGDGGDAAGGILNLSTGTISLDLVRMETSVSSTGGDGGVGSNGSGVGYNGGDGGDGCSAAVESGNTGSCRGCPFVDKRRSNGNRRCGRSRRSGDSR